MAQEVPQEFALDLSMGIKAWISPPQFYKGKGVICELRLANTRGVTVMVAMNRLRVLHMGMLHEDYQCLCQEAEAVGQTIDGMCRVLSGGTGGMTPTDWVAVGQMFWASMAEQARQDCREERIGMELTGKHRDEMVIHTGRQA